jgi:threonine dehydratase
MLVVTDEQIAMAMAHAYSDMGLVVEGSAAAALAPLLFGLPEGARGGDLVVVLTGRNVDAERLDAVLRRVGEQSPA